MDQDRLLGRAAGLDLYAVVEEQFKGIRCHRHVTQTEDVHFHGIPGIRLLLCLVAVHGQFVEVPIPIVGANQFLFLFECIALGSGCSVFRVRHFASGQLESLDVMNERDIRANVVLNQLRHIDNRVGDALSQLLSPCQAAELRHPLFTLLAEQQMG